MTAGRPGGPLSGTADDLRGPRRDGQHAARTHHGVFVGLGAALLILAVVSACLGQVPTGPAEVVGSLLHRIGLDLGPMPAHPAGEVTLWEVRFPRVVLAILVGAALGCAGRCCRACSPIPLAEPGVIGVSAGAAVGAQRRHRGRRRVHGRVDGGRGRLVAGLITTVAVYILARHEGRTEVVTLVLTGVAVNAFAGGLIAFFTFVAIPRRAIRSSSGNSAASTGPPGTPSRWWRP